MYLWTDGVYRGVLGRQIFERKMLFLGGEDVFVDGCCVVGRQMCLGQR